MADADDLTRARQGRDAWNAWAQANLGAKVDFSDMTLRDISFAGFEFPGQADFSNTEISTWIDFSGTVFHGPACFRYTKFNLASTFWRAFELAIFKEIADFYSASFIHGPVNFSWAVFEKRFQLSVAADERDKKRIPEISFEGCEFHGKADFSDRIFEGTTNFRSTIFHKAPAFHGASIHQETEFGSDIDNMFRDFQSEGAEQRYRTLKLAMGQHQARTEEAAFAALELKARRRCSKNEAKKNLGWKRFLPGGGLSACAERGAYWLWEKCSDSGRSFIRPVAIYTFLIWPAFAAVYVLLAKRWLWLKGLHYSFLKQFSFGAVFRGEPSRIPALEKALFDLNESGLLLLVALLNAAQFITALILIFLMGLGIRHKFRLR